MSEATPCIYERMRSSSHLLPDPGGEIVRDCLDQIDFLHAELAHLRAENERLRKALEKVKGAHFLDLSSAPEKSAVAIADAALAATAPEPT